MAKANVKVEITVTGKPSRKKHRMIGITKETQSVSEYSFRRRSRPERFSRRSIVTIEHWIRAASDEGDGLLNHSTQQGARILPAVNLISSAEGIACHVLRNFSQTEQVISIFSRLACGWPRCAIGDVNHEGQSAD